MDGYGMQKCESNPHFLFTEYNFLSAPDQDLVPEPPLQDEEGDPGERF